MTFLSFPSRVTWCVPKGRPWMLRKLPGIDIPIATEANILHAAAYLEFKQHVERLVGDRHDTAAKTCWMHAVEVGHSPFVLPTTTEVAALPPLPKMPCCKPDCQRCAAHSGGQIPVAWSVEHPGYHHPS